MDNVDELPGLNEEEVASLSQWQRISPIGVLYFIESVIKVLINNFVYVIGPALLAFKWMEEVSEYAGIAVVTGVLLLLLYTILAYYFYQFRVAADSVEIRSGVFSKKFLNLPFSRIQNISVVQPFYYRLSDYVCLELDTAGSVNQEAKIVALSPELGHQLRAHILKHRVSDDASEPTIKPINRKGLTEQTTDETLLNRRSVMDLIIHGITSNRIWILLGAAAPFYEVIASRFSDYLLSLGLDLESLFSSQSLAWWQLGLYAMSITLVLMSLLIILSIMGSIFMFYGFTLSKDKDRYIRRSGLLTRHEVSIKQSRLQMIVRKQDWLDRILGRINLRFEQNSAGYPGENSLNSQNTLMVPSVKELECQSLINDALPDNQLANIRFTPIRFHFFLRNLALYILPLFGALLTLSIFIDRNTETIAVSSAAILCAFLLYLRWRRWGYAWDEEFVYIRKGLLGVDYYCFPIYKIQQTQFYQSIFMKRRQLAHCEIVLACGGQRIPFIPNSVCQELIDYCLYKAEKENKSWM